eukprot:Nk52_evm27s215 gene=Nk52_evmTU27s215
MTVSRENIAQQLNSENPTMIQKEPEALKFIETRHCTRDFDSSKEVPLEFIHSVIRAARNAPSSQNNQPWFVHVVEGEKRDEFSRKLLKVWDEGIPKKGEYANRPNPLPQYLKENIDNYGKECYTDKLGLERTDTEGRKAFYRSNYEFWGAPIQIVVCGPREASAGTFLDLGLFLQNLLLGFHMFGLGAIPQFSIAGYPEVVKEHLNIDDSKMILCGISVGWPAPVVKENGEVSEGTHPEWNGFFPSRRPISEFTTWHCSADSTPSAE